MNKNSTYSLGAYDLMPVLREHTVFFILAIVWIAMVLCNFGLPGLHFDEANHYAFSPGILSEAAARLHHYRLPDNWLDLLDGRYRFPILGGSFYNSVIGAYVGIPFFATLGFSVETLRLFEGLLALSAILSCVLLVGRAFGWGPALLFGLVTVTDPVNVFSARSQGNYFWYVVLFASAGANFLLLAYRRAHPSIWLAIGAGAGAGLSVLSYFVGAFFALPLMACGLWVFWRRPAHLLAFIASCVIAYSPVIYSIGSVYALKPQLLESFGFPDFALEKSIPSFSAANVIRVIELIENGLGRYGFAQSIVGQFGDEFSYARLAAIGAGILALFFLVSRSSRQDITARAVRLGLACSFLTFMVGAFFLKAISGHHVIPFALTIFILVASLAACGKIGKGISVGVCGVLIATNLNSLGLAHKELLNSGGVGYHNESYSMPGDLFRVTLKDYHPVFASWGLHLQFLFQTRGSIPYTFVGAPSPGKLAGLMKKHGKVALVIDTDDRVFLKSIDSEVASELNFSQRDGVPLFDILLFGPP